MLDPEYLERAGDLVGAVYSEIEAEMCDHLVTAMLDGDVSDWRSQRALQMLGQGEATQLAIILERYRDEIDEAVRREVEEALDRSDAADLAVVKRALGVELPTVTTQQVAGVVRTVTEMLSRDNVAMLDGARDAFFRESSAALTEAASGLVSPWEASRRAAMRLARQGISTIQYKDPTTGEKTVRSRADVAVRRHVRTQLAQACANRTMQVCDDVGCGFVEVSAHVGARPSHQDWEGRCYSLHGRVTVDGVTYEDFWEATGYQGLTGDHAALGDRLQGVNCRHHFGPWFPGMPRTYHPSPAHQSGMSSEEVYELTQKQRRLERAIRDTKRELSAARIAYRERPDLKTLTEANKVRDRLVRQEKAIQQLVDEHPGVLTRQANREWAGDMPRVKVPKASAASPSPKGAIRGDEERMKGHAKAYYESVRKMDRAKVLRAIERESGLTPEESERAFSHLLIEEHDLEGGIRRFDEDYEISQSIQRILSGRGVCQHDRLLFQHEVVESVYMGRGMPYTQAHDRANLLYNYQEALIAWLRRGAKSGD